MKNNHNIENDSSQYEDIEQWACPLCFKTISASRPPIFNSDNCCCAEAGAFADGQEIQAAPYDQTYQYHDTHMTYHHVPQSNASSSNSVPCPEGPEREVPNFHFENHYLPLVPEPGLNEPQHQRMASFRAHMPHQLEQFLVQHEDHQVFYATEHAPSETKFLQQDTHVQGGTSVPADESSRRSKQSQRTGYDSVCRQGSFVSWGIDPTTGMGAWVDVEGIAYTGESYSMTLSGLTGFTS